MKNNQVLKFLILFCAIVFIASGNVYSGKDVILRFNPEIGKSIKYRSESSQVITQIIGGMHEVIDQSQSVNFTFTALDKNADGNTLVEILFTRIEIEITSQGSVRKFDSDKNDISGNLDPNFLGYAVLVGKSCRAHISHLGEVVVISGISEMLNKMVDQIAGRNDTIRQSLKTFFETNVTPDVLKLMISGATLQLPDHLIKPDEIWITHQNFKNQFILFVESNNKLKKIEDEVVTVEYNSKLNTIPDEITVVGGRDMIFNLTGTQRGVVKIDRRFGSVIESSFKQAISGKIFTDMNGKIVIVPITIESASRTFLND